MTLLEIAADNFDSVPTRELLDALQYLKRVTRKPDLSVRFWMAVQRHPYGSQARKDALDAIRAELDSTRTLSLASWGGFVESTTYTN